MKQNPNHERYLELAPHHTEPEIAELMQLNQRTIRRYASITDVKPLVDQFRKRSLDDWVGAFDNQFKGALTVKNPRRNNAGKVIGDITCTTCNTQWTAQIGAKINVNAGCIRCDKGNHGNIYSHQEVEDLLNEQYRKQWKLLTYGRYSKKESVIECSICNHQRTVNLADVINTTSKRCTNCQTGSFGEYVIRNTLLFNEIPFESELIIPVNGKKYRLDFLIDNRVALEYSGLQHFEEGLYYNPLINEGVVHKKKWATDNGYEFHEIRAVKTFGKIRRELVKVLKQPLQTPSPEFFAESDEAMINVLDYMRDNSARKTTRDLNIPMTKIKRYVQLAGYTSISAWQAENQRIKI